MFYFDASFRPVPLEQHFIGVKGKPGSALSKKNMDYVVFQKVMELVKQGHQVMVFVHARKETLKTAMTLQEMAVEEGDLELFKSESTPQWNNFRREVGESRHKELRTLFDNGFGIHHAGMLRSDRNVMERLFEARAIKVITTMTPMETVDSWFQVLCCTATLAWGVNLPAHAGTNTVGVDLVDRILIGFSRHQGHTSLRFVKRCLRGSLCARRFADLRKSRSPWSRN